METKNHIQNHIVSQKSTIRFLKIFLKSYFFNWITKNSPPLFFRAHDSISVGVLTTGQHEPQVLEAVKFLAKCGNNDFFIDVGANIGLTSAECGDLFERVIAFEPNPLCVGVLNTNLTLSCTKTEFTVNPFGLGLKDERLKLRVPIKNWGAYIVSKDNSYSSETLLKKDGFNSFDASNYITVDVEIKSATEILLEVFSRLASCGKTQGIIKIDVEGFESVVINAISKTLPEGFNVSIIFEHLDNAISPDKFLNSFNGGAELYCLEKYPCVAGNWPSKLLALLIAGRQTFKLNKWREGACATDFVIDVK
jgi:FkbM family methyltransferase